MSKQRVIQGSGLIKTTLLGARDLFGKMSIILQKPRANLFRSFDE